MRHPPPDAIASGMVMAVGSRATDTDGDGLGETILLTAYLFADRRYNMPYWPAGGFTFVATPTGSSGPDREVARWVFTPEQAEASRARFGPGPAYVFQMSLMEPGIPAAARRAEALEVRGWFDPVAGPRVSAGREVTVRLDAGG
ncbi:MAG: hypothetical protein AAF138_06910 [Planctomycetota bacterium]